MIHLILLYKVYAICFGLYLLSLFGYSIYSIVRMRQKGEKIGLVEIIVTLVMAIPLAFFWYIFMPFKIWDHFTKKSYLNSLK